jgi:hypothetical protein
MLNYADKSQASAGVGTYCHFSGWQARVSFLLLDPSQSGVPPFSGGSFPPARLLTEPLRGNGKEQQ